MFGYFRMANVVETHKLIQVIERHCLTIEYMTQLETSDAEISRDGFGEVLRRMSEYSNTGARGGKFGKSDVYDNAELNLPNAGKALPGSRGKYNARCPNLQNWSISAQQERRNE